MSDVVNTLRRGSAGWAAVEAVREHGPLSPGAMALTIDKPADEIDQLLQFPVRVGLLRITADGRYALGDGTPLPVQPARVPPEAETEHRQRNAAQVELLQAEVAVRRAQKAPAPRAAAKPEKPAAPAAMQGVDIDAVHKQRDQHQAPAVVAIACQLAAPQEATPPPATPAPVPAVERMLAAWCSDGTYVIEKGSARIELDRDEALELFEHMSVMARAA